MKTKCWICSAAVEDEVVERSEAPFNLKLFRDLRHRSEMAERCRRWLSGRWLLKSAASQLSGFDEFLGGGGWGFSDLRNPANQMKKMNSEGRQTWLGRFDEREKKKKEEERGERRERIFQLIFLLFNLSF